MSVTFKDIHAMIASRPVLNTAKTADNTLIAQLERTQGCCHPEIRHPRAAYYASAYGPDDIAETKKTLQSIAEGKHGIQKFCAKLNADLRVYELTTDTPLPAQGLSEQEAAHLLAYGLMAVEEHVDCLMIGSLSVGFREACEAFDRAMQDDKDGDVFALAAAFGGQDLCALIGAALSARMAKIPVVAGFQTGRMLQRALARLYPEADSTLVVASEDETAEPIRILHYAYQTIGALVAAETIPQKEDTASCVGCAA